MKLIPSLSLHYRFNFRAEGLNSGWIWEIYIINSGWNLKREHEKVISWSYCCQFLILLPNQQSLNYWLYWYLNMSYSEMLWRVVINAKFRNDIVLLVSNVVDDSEIINLDLVSLVYIISQHVLLCYSITYCEARKWYRQKTSRMCLVYCSVRPQLHILMV